MAYDEQLARRIRHIVAERNDVSELKMFGGLAFLFAGRMGCGVVREELMVRLPAGEYDEAMRQAHVRPMDFTGRPLKNFIYVAAEGFTSKASLEKWVASAIRAAGEAAEKKAHGGGPGGSRTTDSKASNGPGARGATGRSRPSGKRPAP